MSWISVVFSGVVTCSPAITFALKALRHSLLYTSLDVCCPPSSLLELAHEDLPARPA